MFLSNAVWYRHGNHTYPRLILNQLMFIMLINSPWCHFSGQLCDTAYVLSMAEIFTVKIIIWWVKYLSLQNICSSVAATALLGLSNERNRYRWFCSHFSPLSSFLPVIPSRGCFLYFSTRKECCSHDYHVVWATQEHNDNSSLSLRSLSHTHLLTHTCSLFFSWSPEGTRQRQLTHSLKL